MSKILIAIPTFENIMPETFKSIYDLDPCGNVWSPEEYPAGWEKVTV